MYISMTGALFCAGLIGFVLGIVFMILLAITWRNK